MYLPRHICTHLSLPDVASVSSGERSILLRRRCEPPAPDAGGLTCGVEIIPAAACLGAIFWAIVSPGRTMPFTGEKLPNGDPNMPIGGHGLVPGGGLLSSYQRARERGGG